MESKVIMFLFVFLFVFTFASASLDQTEISDDYFGYLHYLSNSTYYFYINDTSKNITFIGVNGTNAHDEISVPFDSSDHFRQRINYVWYDGWFDTQNLYLNEYVPLEVFYSQEFKEINGTYFANFTIEEIPLLNLTNITLNVTMDKTNGIGIIEFDQHAELNSSAPIFLVFNGSVSPHFYGAIALETRLVQNETDELMEVHLWFKDDIGDNGLRPHWISPLNSVNGEFIHLISPVNSQVFEISGTETNIHFEFSVNLSVIGNENLSCLINFINNGVNELIYYPNHNDNSSIWGVDALLRQGVYNWSVSCNTQNKLFNSDSSSFTISRVNNHPPIIITQEEGGGRRRITLPLENLSFNSSQNLGGNENNNGSIISLITGAVTGLIGKKGALGFGILLLIVGIGALLIHNRERFGLVKKKI
ncbi:MAG: hypothetical protein AABX23_02990 [Nanoarchaeota archaeon]